MNKPSSETDSAIREADRLLALHRLGLMDSSKDSGVDHLVTSLMEILRFPIGFVSLIDEDRQWFRSIRGLKISETPRDIAICDHTIRDEFPMIVEDLMLDPRFADNPLVKSEPYLRAYAGAPI